MSGLVESLGVLIGGIGLFLLGITMMTNGLKLAAGPALELILSRATRTPAAGLASGVLVTALVQSSSAVTVAVIGFVNAGLLDLGGALWVLFGANLGMTTTGWIVSLLGLKMKIDALALPLVGIGIALRLTGVGQRRGALGDALAGFGILFIGIATLQGAFTGLVAQYRLPQGEGLVEVLMQVFAGLVITLLVQSSSATMTITLAAAQGGMLSTQGGAAVIIGANIGTTATALLAAVGATPNARRAAVAQVIFNVVTGLVATALLPWMIGFIVRVGDWLHLPHDPAIALALFHTAFNVLGLVIMVPLAGRLTRWLQSRFRAREGDEGAPQFLDDTVAVVPELAADALRLEVRRIGAIVRRMVRMTLAGADAHALAHEQSATTRLFNAAQKFVQRMNRQEMVPATAAALAESLRELRYHESAAEQAMQAAALANVLPDAGVAASYAQFERRSLALLDAIEAVDHASRENESRLRSPGEDSALIENLSQAMEGAYGALKAQLLGEGAAGTVSIALMEELLRRHSALRRALQQVAKAHSRALSFAD
ncbi:Na/Pi symporter [Paraburkholderia tropica]|uniref:Phosphate:Na+ symporter n=1 Tax=Paraburkholderia tropica TaxID=92647 RepID=A0AAQ1GDH5_9BURK|nr:MULTISPECIES: Na/Pi symporter [Paraburkholderia]RQM50882.1 Na/Pi cotransporter family protein [Paraburkholderia bannensis]RQN40387.1 Na/Pi cotransporter family protein [Paraburkholderia tropica]SEJ35572.1 phosphate:Na+ symporter [Paraburkholderia tropica]